MDDHTPLKPVVSKNCATNWGTATLRSDGNITVHIGSPTAKPIHVCLTRPLVLGRFVGNDPGIHINLEAYAAGQKGVSRQHASLTMVDKNVILTDLNSVNGTFLNGQQLCQNKHYMVRNGDEIRLGKLALYIFL